LGQNPENGQALLAIILLLSKSDLIEPLGKLPAGGWIGSGHDFSRAAKRSKETPALAAEELQAIEKTK
jgi:hypothetical protein